MSDLEDENRRLRMESEFLKNSRGLLRPDAAVAERCALIEAEKATYSIAWMCLMLGVPRSTFYAWRHRAETPTAARRRELAAPVRRVFDESRQTSGCRRVAAQLNREGICCSVGLVADLMRELGLKAVQPRAYKRTTLPGEEPVAAADLIDGEFTAAHPGQRLVGPALTGYGAETMKDALAASITTLPEQLRRSLTWDRGKELAQHAQFKIETGVAVYFAQSLAARDQREQQRAVAAVLPEGHRPVAMECPGDRRRIAHALNNRPRKTLGWKTPAEALNEQLLLLQHTGVATTP